MPCKNQAATKSRSRTRHYSWAPDLPRLIARPATHYPANRCSRKSASRFHPAVPRSDRPGRRLPGKMPAPGLGRWVVNRPSFVNLSHDRHVSTDANSRANRPGLRRMFRRLEQRRNAFGFDGNRRGHYNRTYPRWSIAGRRNGFDARFRRHV